MITIGTNVAIMPGTDYSNRFAGKVGTVCKYYQNKIGVRIDGRNNPESEYGVFWFKEESLAVIPSNIVRDDAVKQVIFNGPKTIILWADGTKTIASCRQGDIFDRYAGFCACVAKKMFGSTSKIKKVIGQNTKEDK